MSYRIEINADSITELAGKLLALAAQMNAAPTDPVMPEVREAPKAKRVKAEKPAEVAEEPVEVAQEIAEEIAPPAEEKASTPEPQAAAALDFEKDVAPLVLNAVKTKGKPWVTEVLGQFGVERASQIDDSRMAEFVAMIREGLEP